MLPPHCKQWGFRTHDDEVMGNAAWFTAGTVLAANLNINYKQPVPLDTPLTLRGWVDRVEGRKYHTLGELRLPDGTIATTGRGLFITIPDERLSTYPDSNWPKFGTTSEE